MFDDRYIPAHERNTAYNDGSMSVIDWLFMRNTKLLDSHMAADESAHRLVHLLTRSCNELAEVLGVNLRGMGLKPTDQGSWNALIGKARELTAPRIAPGVSKLRIDEDGHGHFFAPFLHSLQALAAITGPVVVYTDEDRASGILTSARAYDHATEEMVTAYGTRIPQEAIIRVERMRFRDPRNPVAGFVDDPEVLYERPADQPPSDKPVRHHVDLGT